MQLVAVGAQNAFLNKDPEFTLMKAVYKRHSNFAIQSIEQTFNGTVDFGRKVTCQVSRSADLIWKTYLEVTLPELSSGTTVAWTRNVGHALIDYVNVEIGGVEIDRHYGDWFNIWNELTQTAEREDGYNVMIGNTSTLTTGATSIPETVLYIPLQFWFCRNPGLSLPLVALQYHEVKINVSFARFSELYIGSPSSTPTLGATSLYIDYIFLETSERTIFARSQHEYLIEQLQFGGGESVSALNYKAKLNMNHPCKEIVWVVQPDANVNSGANRWSDYTNSGTDTNNFYIKDDTIVNAKLQLNNQDRFSTRSAAYFNIVQPYQHHTRCPATGIYVYSFALNPEKYQPSGTVNMSRIDNATLQLTLASADAAQIRVYAVNYNVLQIMSGLGGLSFAN